MRPIFKSLPSLLIFGLVMAASARAQDALPPCPPRPLNGQPVKEPPSLSSQNGVLSVGLTLKTQIGLMNYSDYCLDYDGKVLGFVESPTLRLNPGDQLIMHLTNGLPLDSSGYGQFASAHTIPVSASESGMEHNMSLTSGASGSGDCSGGPMTSTATNMHFHGLNVPPTCHQDDVINTVILPGDPAFEFRITIPQNDAPGLYWYHPHPHGFTTTQVNGGAAGAIIIEGMEKLRPEVAGLRERLLILRQQFPNSKTWVPGPFEYTLNYQPSILPPPRITMKPGTKEFWRFVNASTQGFLNLQVKYGTTVQKLEIIALDGIPLSKPLFVGSIPLAPASRAEFIVEGPPSGETGTFATLGVTTGAVGNRNPHQQLAVIEPGPTGGDDLPLMPPLQPQTAKGTAAPQRFADLIHQTPTVHRKLYFSEATIGTNGPTKYYITEAGEKPHIYSMGEPPAIKTTIGAVEDWTIENRAQENHAFHIHQIHFLVMEINGVPVNEPYLADTITVPFWSGTGPYPRVKMRMDFRDPDIAGTFVYHCHVLQHEDNGMMAKIEVDPAR
jgi:FtsP/CotA-like multicopper oxidase with cupredoxin domain